VLKERAKVELVFDEELEKLIPKRPTIIEVKLTDGTQLTERVDNVRGTPDNPMTKDEVAAKARDLVAPSLGAAKAEQLIATIWNIEAVKNIRELRSLIQKG
jgi:2-methylcitrate dehydratase PrpD